MTPRIVPPPLPPSFIHVDLDGLWTLASCYGYAEGDSFDRDPTFERALPRMLDLFDRLDVKATFFLVGRDLEHPGKREAVGEIVRRGHEVANHTYHHPFGLEELPAARIREEIGRAQHAIAEATGSAPLGFRAPGYDAGPKVLQTLADLGFAYDGSSLPTYWAPLLRFSAGRLRNRVQEARRQLAEAGNVPSSPSVEAPVARGQYGPGGGGAWGIAPGIFRPASGGRPLTRLPLAVSPVFRLPLHASLGMLLGRSSVISGLRRLTERGWPVTYLLHGMDLTAPEEFGSFLPPELSGSRVFSIPLADREEFLDEVLGALRQLTSPQRTTDYLRGAGDLG